MTCTDSFKPNISQLERLNIHGSDRTDDPWAWARRGVTSPGLDIGQARHKATVCARGAGNLILWLTPVTFEKKKMYTEMGHTLHAVQKSRSTDFEAVNPWNFWVGRAYNISFLSHDLKCLPHTHT